MPVRISRLMRVALIRTIDLQSRGALPGDHMQHLAKQYRKPWSEMLRRMQRQMLSTLEQEAKAEATEMVRSVAHNMLLSGKPTSAESQRLLIERETAELLEEKLLSKKEPL